MRRFSKGKFRDELLGAVDELLPPAPFSKPAHRRPPRLALAALACLGVLIPLTLCLPLAFIGRGGPSSPQPSGPATGSGQTEGPLPGDPGPTFDFESYDELLSFLDQRPLSYDASAGLDAQPESLADCFYLFDASSIWDGYWVLTEMGYDRLEFFSYEGICIDFLYARETLSDLSAACVEVMDEWQCVLRLDHDGIRLMLAVVNGIGAEEAAYVALEAMKGQA